VLALTFAGPAGIKVTIFNESPAAIRVELWQHKDLAFRGAIEGNKSNSCRVIPPGEPLVVQIDDAWRKTFEKELDVYYETGYTGEIRVFFENGKITYEDELEMPGPRFGPPPKPRRRS
jgi:hypothetical protein